MSDLRTLTRRTRRSGRLLLAVSVAALLTALAGCGSDAGSGGSDDATSAAGHAGPAAKLVPSDLKSKGTLVVATDSTYPPADFTVGGKVQGWNIDLGRAIAQQLGLRFTFAAISFDQLIPGIQAKRYDIGMSTIFITPERRKAVDFVTYFNDAKGIMVPQGGNTAVKKLSDLCGLKVAVLKGSAEAADVTKQNTACKNAGSKPITTKVFPSQNDANLALSSGRAQVDLADWQTLSYIAKKASGKFTVTGKYDVVPAGIALPENSSFIKAVRAAMKSLIADGQYRKILSKWGVSSGAITEPDIVR